MGFGDKLKGLKDQAQQAVAENKDKIQGAVLRKAVADSLGKPGPLARWLEPRLPKALYHPRYILTLVVGNILVAVYFGSVWMWRHIPEVVENEHEILKASFGFAVILSLLLSGLGGFVALRTTAPSAPLRLRPIEFHLTPSNLMPS